MLATAEADRLPGEHLQEMPCKIVTCSNQLKAKAQLCWMTLFFKAHFGMWSFAEDRCALQLMGDIKMLRYVAIAKLMILVYVLWVIIVKLKPLG